MTTLGSDLINKKRRMANVVHVVGFPNSTVEAVGRFSIEFGRFAESNRKKRESE